MLVPADFSLSSDGVVLQERELLAAEDLGTDQQPQSAPAETAEEAAPAEEAAASVNAQQLQRQV